MRLLAFAIGVGAAAVAGCSYLGTAEEFDPSELEREADWRTVRDVPLVRQRTREDCGAAALAMVLTHWRVPASLGEIAAVCPPEPGRGIRAGDLRDYARRTGLRAYLFEGRPDDLERELSQGRPLLVGLVKPHLGASLTHFEVVVAVHRASGDVVTLDPARGWSRNTREGFLREWTAARRLTLLVFRDGPQRS